MKQLLMLIVVFLHFTATAQAEPKDVVFRSQLDGTEQRYVEFPPPTWDSTKACDVVIALHGHGSDRWQFVQQNRGECKGVRDVAAKHGMLLISPDYRAKTSWMGPKAEADVVQLIAELKQKYSVKRVFITGGSMGGTASLIFTALHPELIAGVCSLNGTANMQEYGGFQDAISTAYGGSKVAIPEEYKKRSAELWSDKFTMPVAITSGGKDTVVPPQSARRLAEKLKQQGRAVLDLYRETGGHSTNYEDTCAAMEFIIRESNSRVEERHGLLRAAEELKTKIASIHSDDLDQLADVKIFQKGTEWALRFDESLLPRDVALVKQMLVRGNERVAALHSGNLGWAKKKGKVVRGFASAVDGSIQPYGVVVPQRYDGKTPLRLDVILHGSSKPTGISELKFMNRFDQSDTDTSFPDVDYIELHPLGRVENCYRWAGETDVFEAIEAACRNYRIDRSRIVLRGMSMGGSGTWHLGLKHPDRFAAIGPYCGYVDTHRFSETPLANFIKVGPLPKHQELVLHMLDSVDYAANASVVPTVAAIGEKDVFFQAHVMMDQAFIKEGLQLVNLIAPGTGHVIDPVTHRDQLRRIAEHVEKGLKRDPKQLRFVTWTLKYNRCHWLEILALDQHYVRAEFNATRAEDDLIEVTNTRNIRRFAINRPIKGLRIEGVSIPIPPHEPADVLVFSKSDSLWKCDGRRRDVELLGKRPGLQGPIDDAFASPFLCVRSTGKAWNASVNDWANANLRRFQYEWTRYMRGELPIKNDTEVTPDDLQQKHLILFGDPGSNSWIAKLLPQLPVKWSREALQFAGETRSSSDHAPALICVNPLSPQRYVVINSGHTFHEKEFAALNYLLFPRHGDWALVKVQPNSSEWQPTSVQFPEEVLKAGFFDETWQSIRSNIQ